MIKSYPVFRQLSADLDKIWHGKLPRNTKSFDKLNCELRFGGRVYWYYKENLDFFLEEYKRYKDFDTLDLPYSGIIVPMEDYSVDDENVIVIMDTYPTEKEACQATWIALYRLIDGDDLVEIINRSSLNIKELKKR